MRECPTCGARFEDRRRVCPKDGEVLLDLGRPAPQTGEAIGGAYRLGLLIGEGGMGQVFEATRLDTGATVAVKLLRQGLSGHKAEKRFRREAETMARLRHPGAVELIDFRVTPTISFIVMERLRGPTFAQLRRAGKFVSQAAVAGLLREVCGVVSAAHRAGIVHRDLKPSNIILHRLSPERSQVKVLDFGIARLLDAGQEEGLTTRGEMLGTLLYMAPEQTSHPDVTPAADVYSLGVILFEALAGRLPFEAGGVLEFLRLQASAPAPALSSWRPDVGADLDEIVARCLSKKPERRYADAGELGRELARVHSVTSFDETVAAPAPSSLRSNPAVWVGTILDDRYELHEWISPGRFGSQVYLATQLRTGAAVAVRLWVSGRGATRDLLIEAFRNEARSIGARHPNLISILDLGYDEQCVYVVTEHIESVSLRALLDARGPLPSSLAARLIRGAAGALAALHERGVVSGGLSPETLRVSGTVEAPEELLLSPFGLVSGAQLRSLLPVGQEERGGDGPQSYLAPEQRAGLAPGPSSDTWSLGAVMAEMLGSKGPARGQGRGDDLPDHWASFLGRALAPRPEERFRDAAGFLAALPEA